MRVIVGTIAHNQPYRISWALYMRPARWEGSTRAAWIIGNRALPGGSAMLLAARFRR